MVEIRPAYTSYEKEEYSDACGFCASEKENLVASFENDNFTGVALYEMYDGYAVITNLGFIKGYYDETSRILLMKGTLNVIDLKGIKDVIFKGSDTELAKKAGFREKDGALKINLEGYFNNPCQKCKEN